jgi:hypothetical protein
LIAARTETEKYVTLDYIISCPVGTSYLLSFLNKEFNAENLQCYLDLILVRDFVDLSIKTAEFELQQLESSESPIETKPEFKTGMHRVKKFFDTYISSDAKYEVNIPHNISTKINALFKEAMELEQTHEKYHHELVNTNVPSINIRHNDLENLRQRMELIDKSMQILRSELIINMTDPFKRYLQSEEWEENFVVFYTSGDQGASNRRKVMSSSMGGLILNDQERIQIGEPRHPLIAITAITETLLQYIREPFHWTLTSNGIITNTEALKSNMHMFNNVAELCCELRDIDMHRLSNDHERICFWIMTYNVMVMLAAIQMQDIPKAYFDRFLYLFKIKMNIAGYLYSLRDIKAAMLRGKQNQSKHPILGKQLKAKDPRWAFAVQTNQPRCSFPALYFALVDCTKQSPSVKYFQPLTLEQDLEELVTQYVKAYATVSDGVCTLPYSFNELSAEFKNKSSKEFIQKYLNANSIKFAKSEKLEFCLECAVEPCWLEVIAKQKGQEQAVIQDTKDIQIKPQQSIQAEQSVQPIQSTPTTKKPSKKKKNCLVM